MLYSFKNPGAKNLVKNFFKTIMKTAAMEDEGGVMVVGAGSGIGVSCSNYGRGCLHILRINAFRKDKNSLLLWVV